MSAFEVVDCRIRQVTIGSCQDPLDIRRIWIDLINVSAAERAYATYLVLRCLEIRRVQRPRLGSLTQELICVACLRYDQTDCLLVRKEQRPHRVSLRESRIPQAR